MKISPIYHPDFLLGDLFNAAKSGGKDAFVTFQARSMLTLIDKNLFDFLVVNILQLNSKGLLDGELISAVYNVRKSVINSYMQNLLHDDFTPLLFSTPGAALFNETLRPMDEWLEKPIYTNHCNLFDYHYVCEVAFAYPLKSPPRLVFFFSKDQNTIFPDWVSEEHIEYLVFPFYLGWLLAYDIIDEQHLWRWLSLLSNMSFARFRVIRALFEPRTLSAPALGDLLGISAKGVHHHIHGTMETLLSVCPELEMENRSTTRVAEIVKAFSFFGFGPGEVVRKYPRRKLLTGKSTIAGKSDFKLFV